MNIIKKVALIDDKEIDHFISREILKKYGAKKIASFKDTFSALAHLTKTKASYDLIILDINTPTVDGFEFIDNFLDLTHQKKHGKLCVMSAFLNPIDRKNCQKRSINFIEKPLSIEKLDHLLKS